MTSCGIALTVHLIIRNPGDTMLIIQSSFKLLACDHGSSFAHSHSRSGASRDAAWQPALTVFFGDEDREACLALLSGACAAQAIRCLACSARSHIEGKRVAGDRLTDVEVLDRHVRNWLGLLRHRPTARPDPAGPSTKAAGGACSPTCTATG